MCGAWCVCVCVLACVRACVRACLRAVRACVRACRIKYISPIKYAFEAYMVTEFSTLTLHCNPGEFQVPVPLGAPLRHSLSFRSREASYRSPSRERPLLGTLSASGPVTASPQADAGLLVTGELQVPAPRRMHSM